MQKRAVARDYPVSHVMSVGLLLWSYRLKGEPMTEQEKYELALYLSEVKRDKPDGYSKPGATISLYFVKVSTTSNKIRNTSGYFDDFNAFSDLEFNARIGVQFGVYAERIEYVNVYTVDLPKSEQMAKMFKRISRIQAKLPFRPQSFGQFVVMIADALGCKQVIQCMDSTRFSDYDEREHRFWTLKEGQGVIDHVASTVLDELKAIPA
jgi:hypothetical protein